MDVKTFTAAGRKGYRFKDASGKGCSVHQGSKGLTLRVNESQKRILMDDEVAMWLVRVVLHYLETGEL